LKKEGVLNIYVYNKKNVWEVSIGMKKN